MILRIILFIVLAAVLGVTAYIRHLRRQMGVDSMNVYRLRMGGAPVYTRLRKFIRVHGFPPAVKIKGVMIPVHSEEDLNELIGSDYTSRYELDLCYNGFRMNYFLGGRLVITDIDFRKTEQVLTYGNLVFDRHFTYSDFSEVFPLSAAQDVYHSTGIQSLFELNTGESACNKETYMVIRWSKDNLLAHPTVEFTFQDGKLIYIFFANF